MARPKKREPTVKSKEGSNPFLETLRFISLVTKDAGTLAETHVILSNKTAVAFNGIVAAGCYIEEDLYAAPHSHTMVSAISKCGEHISINTLDGNRLAIKSNKFKVMVSCIDPISITGANPDPNQYVLSENFKIALSSVGVLANEDAQTVATQSILMAGQSVISTSGVVLFEYWHGIDLPNGIALPKSVITPIVKSGKKLIGFGHSDTSATFWFEDNSWIRTQLYKEPWPDLSAILAIQPNLLSIPKDFWPAVDAVSTFSPDGLLYFESGQLKSHASEGHGATHDVAGLPRGLIYSAKQLALIKPYAEKIDFLAPGPHGSKCLYFVGGMMRGVLAGRVKG